MTDFKVLVGWLLMGCLGCLLPTTDTSPTAYNTALNGAYIPYEEMESFGATLYECREYAMINKTDGYTYIPPFHENRMSAKSARFIHGQCMMLKKSDKFTFQYGAEKWSWRITHREENDDFFQCPIDRSPRFVGIERYELRGVARYRIAGRGVPHTYCVAADPLPAECQSQPMGFARFNYSMVLTNDTFLATNSLFCSRKMRACGADLQLYQSSGLTSVEYKTEKMEGYKEFCIVWDPKYC